MIMKHRLLLTAFVLLAAVAGRADELINEENFPDANFRNWLLSQEYGKDGVLTHDEVLDITEINVIDKGIEKLKGIEYFTALKFLYCSKNKLTALDVSENTALVELYCCENQLKELDFSKNKGLLSLRIFNNQIKGSAMDALIASLPTVTNRNMRVIGYEGEQNVITVEQVKAVKAKGWNPLYYTNGSWLECTGAISINETTFPDENFRNWVLSQDYGKDGMLTDREIFEAKEITPVALDIKSLKGIEYFTELKSLICRDNELSSLDVSKNTAMTELNCEKNQLTSLDVSKNTAMTELNCARNQLTSLDVSKNTALTYLGCNENQLTSLDVSKNTNLEYLYCYQYQLTSLDVSKNTNLELLSCYDNQLTSLFVSKDGKLNNLYCFQNRIKGAAMDALVETLPSSAKNANFVVIDYENEQNEMTDAQVKAAKAKGWTPLCYNAFGMWQPYPGQETMIADIASPLGETEEGAVYDLSGRRVEKPGKGIFIRNGRKVAAK